MKGLRIFLFLIASLSLLKVSGQSDDDNIIPARKHSRFHLGLYVGSYFANEYTASVYDGYGFDSYHTRYDFANSLMYNRIVKDYGGGYGQPDLIAQALNVNHDDWSFNEDNMPINMHYQPAFLIGLNTMFKLSKTNSLLFNLNAAQLSVQGNFSITINNISVGNQVPGFANQRIFGIKGKEQRLQWQLGYQKIIGDPDRINFFYEGGAVCTMTKFVSEQILIGNLLINLQDYYNIPGYYIPAPQNILGIGFGIFAGFGINIPSTSKWSAQLIYTPSYENLYFGPSPTFTFQQSVGLRAML